MIMERTVLAISLVVTAVAPIAEGLAAQQRGQPATGGATNGRFQMIINPGVRADTFLPDTQNGRVWRPVQYTDAQGEPTLRQPEDRARPVHEGADAGTSAAKVEWVPTPEWRNGSYAMDSRSIGPQGP